jgi:hypothetical protein
MRLFNLEGSAIFGPGSEWFWSMASFVVVVVSLAGIYRQIRLQAHASATEQLAEFRREAYSEQMLRCVLDVLVALRDHKDPADIPDGAVLKIGDYWENMAVLARSGHRDLKLLWRYDPASSQLVWAWIAPWVRKVRAESRFGLPSYHDLEWLAGAMAKMDRQAGRQVITPVVVMNQLATSITLHHQLIRYTQAPLAEAAGA